MQQEETATDAVTDERPHEDSPEDEQIDFTKGLDDDEDEGGDNGGSSAFF